MSKKNITKTKIEQILLNPPPTNIMLQELRFNNILVRTRAGNIENLAITNQHVVERVWKAFKIQTLLENSSKELKQIGLDPQAIIQNHGLSEGETKNGPLELEIFRYEDLDIN